ncbi:hypothetical protein [Eggerthella timonensis]|uniref:hypothetical protein n=1 Tax=Eggerthella timonensis TaxID=1871008 RepID=UPI000C77FBCB|nr:hypothetical protein [Eggerthella timonensis]
MIGQDVSANEKTYTKADVMRALALVEAPIAKDPKAIVLEKAVAEFNLVNTGANLLADALIDGMGQEEVSRRKLAECFKIALRNILEMARKGINTDLGGIA